MSKKPKIGVDDHYSVLQSLRCGVDQKVWHYEYEDWIWLKQHDYVHPDYNRKIYLSMCCYADDPCDRHRKIQEEIDKAKLN